MTGVPQAAASTAGKPEPFARRRQQQRQSAAMDEAQFIVRHKSHPVHQRPVPSCGDEVLDVPMVAVEDVSAVAPTRTRCGARGTEPRATDA